MKNTLLVALAASALFLSAGPAHAAPSKDIVQPAQGLATAQEACPRYAGDETREIACVLFHSGAVKKTNGQYQVNVQMLEAPQANTGRTAGHVVKCRAEMIYLPDGGIGWKETSDCR